MSVRSTNKMIVDRIKGMESNVATEASDADPQNPVAAAPPTTTLTTRLRELMAEATPGPLKVVGVRMEDGSISVGPEKHRIVIADFTNAASFGDFIKEAFERRTFGSPDAAKTQWANVNLYLELVNNAPTIIRLLEAGESAEKALTWALPLAEIAMEDHRLIRLKAGHKFGTKRIGLYDNEVEQIESAIDALATLRAAREAKS